LARSSSVFLWGNPGNRQSGGRRQLLLFSFQGREGDGRRETVARTARRSATGPPGRSHAGASGVVRPRFSVLGALPGMRPCRGRGMLRGLYGGPHIVLTSSSNVPLRPASQRVCARHQETSVVIGDLCAKPAPRGAVVGPVRASRWIGVFPRSRSSFLPSHDAPDALTHRRWRRNRRLEHLRDPSVASGHDPEAPP